MRMKTRREREKKGRERASIFPGGYKHLFKKERPWGPLRPFPTSRSNPFVPHLARLSSSSWSKFVFIRIGEKEPLNSWIQEPCIRKHTYGQTSIQNLFWSRRGGGMVEYTLAGSDSLLSAHWNSSYFPPREFLVQNALATAFVKLYFGKRVYYPRSYTVTVIIFKRNSVKSFYPLCSHIWIWIQQGKNALKHHFNAFSYCAILEHFFCRRPHSVIVSSYAE